MFYLILQQILRMAKSKRTRFFFKWLLRLLIVFIIITIIPVFIFKYAHPPVTPLMIIRSMHQASDDTTKRQYNWIPIEKMSPYIYQAAIAAEDDHFMTHHGFDMEAMELAFESNQDHKQIKGGSTISQQTAKNVFLWPHRDYVRKGMEAWFTFLIETIWGKKKIMETYLNVVELGDGIFGVEAASQKYFKKPASKLNTVEAAALLAVFPNPHIYKVIKPSEYTKEYKIAIVKRMSCLPKVKFE